MKGIKSVLLAFVVGGAFAVVGQGITFLWLEVLGQDSLFIGFALLVSMGVIGAVMFVLGIHQPIEEASGFGTILTFNGLCAAIANAYSHARSEKGTIGAGIAASLKMIGFVLGVGSALILVLAIIVFFVS